MRGEREGKRRGEGRIEDKERGERGGKVRREG